ncbi:uncharacterized protein [Periplaneta americana]|uniref:uncharacterized protein isoform X3 n=1 Tax=Periplaneta americana TaxID=6978 RepID=UPI0037E7DEEF
MANGRNKEEKSGTTGNESKSLKILDEIKHLYQARLRKIDEEAGSEGAEIKIRALQSWVVDLGEQNAMLVQTVEQLEREASHRVTLLREGLQRSSQAALAYMTKLDDYDKTFSPEKNAEEAKLHKPPTDSLMSQTIEELNERLQKALQEKEQLAEEVEQLNGQLNNGLAEIERLTKTMNDMKQSAKDMREALTAEVADKHDRIVCLRREIQLLEERCRQADMQTHFKDDIIKEMRKDMKVARLKLATLDPENQHTITSNDQLFSNLPIFHSSRFPGLSFGQQEQHNLPNLPQYPNNLSNDYQEVHNVAPKFQKEHSSSKKPSYSFPPHQLYTPDNLTKVQSEKISSRTCNVGDTTATLHSNNKLVTESSRVPFMQQMTEQLGAEEMYYDVRRRNSPPSKDTQMSTDSRAVSGATGDSVHVSNLAVQSENMKDEQIHDNKNGHLRDEEDDIKIQGRTMMNFDAKSDIFETENIFIAQKEFPSTSSVQELLTEREEPELRNLIEEEHGDKPEEGRDSWHEDLKLKEAEIADLRAKLQEAEKLVDDLRNEKEAVEMRMKETEEKLQDANMKLSDAAEKEIVFKKLEDSLMELKEKSASSLKNEKGISETYRRKCEVQQIELDEIKAELMVLKEKEEEYETLKSEMEKLKTNLSSKEKISANHQEMISILQDSVNMAQKEQQQLQEKLEVSASENENLTRLLTEEQAKCANLQEALLATKQQLEDVQGSNSKYEVPAEEDLDELQFLEEAQNSKLTEVPAEEDQEAMLFLEGARNLKLTDVVRLMQKYEMLLNRNTILEREVKDLKTKLENCKQQLKLTEELTCTSQEEVDLCKETLDSLKQKFSFLKTMLKQKSESLAQLQADYEVVQNNLAIERAQYTKLATEKGQELANLRQNIKDLQVKIKKTEMIYQRIMGDDKKYQQMLVDAANREVRLQKEFTEREKQQLAKLKSSQTEEMVLSDTVHLLNTELQNIRSELAERDAQLQSVACQNQLSVQTIERQQKDLEMKDEKIKNLQDSVNNVDKSLVATVQRLEEKEDLIKNMQVQMCKLRKQMELEVHRGEEVVTLQKEAMHLKTEIKRLILTQERTNAENSSFREAVCKLQSEVLHVRARSKDVEKLEAENATLRSKLLELEEQNDILEKELSKMDDSFEQLLHDYQCRMDSLLSLEEELSKVTLSHNEMCVQPCNVAKRLSVWLQEQRENSKNLGKLLEEKEATIQKLEENEKIRIELVIKLRQDISILKKSLEESKRRESELTSKSSSVSSLHSRSKAVVWEQETTVEEEQLDEVPVRASDAASYVTRCNFWEHQLQSYVWPMQ